MLEINKLHCMDVLEGLSQLDDDSVDTIITSPPYWGLRDYGEETNQIWDGDENCKHEWVGEKSQATDNAEHKGESCPGFRSDRYLNQPQFKGGTIFCSKCGAWYGQLGLEPTLDLYIQHLLQITAELKRVLKPTGVMFWNHGDCYGGSGSGTWSNPDGKCKESYIMPFGSRQLSKLRGTSYQKCLMLQNYRLLINMVDQQEWILRNIIIWNKPNHMPSSVKDRFTNSYEPVFMLTKEKHYWFDLDAVRKPHQYPDDVLRRIRQDKADGIFPFNKNSPLARRRTAFNIKERAEKGGKPVAFMASPKEMAKRKLSEIPEANTGFFNKEPYKENNPHRMRLKKQKFITPEQQKETQDKTGWIEGSGRIRSFFDNFGGGIHPLGKNPGDVWEISTQAFPEAHFATFPEKLVEPMIKAGCPKWICKKCGKARTRIMKQIRTEEKTSDTIAKRDKGSSRNYGGMRWESHSETLGWTDCGCNAGWEAGVVLDPFIGSGTVALVAKRFQRNYLGFDNNPEYIKIAEKRISKVQISMFD